MPTLTAFRSCVLLLAIASTPVLAACGGGSSDPGRTHILYVSVKAGSDANPGTEAAPFLSISRAIQDARTASEREAGSTIRIESGVYDSLQETFPIVVPPGVVLEKIGQGSSPIVRGGALIPPAHGSGLTAAVVLEAYATIRGLEVTNTLTVAGPPFHYGIVMAGDQAAVSDCSVVGSLTGGIRVVDGNDILIESCSIGNHLAGIGLHFAGGGVGGRVLSTGITYNRIGVEYDAPGAALHGEASPAGRVQIFGNTDTDVWVAPGIQVDARGCNWDHVPPQISTTDVGGGVDVFHQGGPAGIDTSDPGPVQI